MQVVPAAEGQEDDEDDDISDPEEDTLAGQMALMKGQPVKRIPDGEGDSESGTDESGSDDDSDTDDSSSDSDSSSSDSD